jgi:hypothetical protein
LLWHSTKCFSGGDKNKRGDASSKNGNISPKLVSLFYINKENTATAASAKTKNHKQLDNTLI